MEASYGKIIVYPCFSAIAPHQFLLKGLGSPGPPMERGSAHAHWIVQVLVRASTEAIQGDGETFYAKLGHEFLRTESYRKTKL
jgi:hypothetical protein